MDTTGQEIFTLGLDSSVFKEGLAYFSIKGNMDISTRRAVVIAPVYDDAGYFAEAKRNAAGSLPWNHKCGEFKEEEAYKDTKWASMAMTIHGIGRNGLLVVRKG